MSISNKQKNETYYIMNICNKSQFYKYYLIAKYNILHYLLSLHAKHT